MREHLDNIRRDAVMIAAGVEQLSEDHKRYDKSDGRYGHAAIHIERVAIALNQARDQFDEALRLLGRIGEAAGSKVTETV